MRSSENSKLTLTQQKNVGCVVALRFCFFTVFLNSIFSNCLSVCVFAFQIYHLSICQWSPSQFWRATWWNSTAQQRPTLRSPSTGEINELSQDCISFAPPPPQDLSLNDPFHLSVCLWKQFVVNLYLHPVKEYVNPQFHTHALTQWRRMYIHTHKHTCTYPVKENVHPHPHTHMHLPSEGVCTCTSTPTHICTYPGTFP